MRSTVILIPSYNCGATLPGLIRQIKSHAPDCETLLVNDGSTDNTSLLLDTLPVCSISHPVRRGKGAALQTGMDWALTHGFRFVITMDADGQHDPADLPKFLKSNADLSVGARTFRPGIMPLARIFSNWTSSRIISLLSGQWVRDSQCGYRKIRLTAVQGFIPRSRHYQYETEMILFIARIKKGRVANIPIRTIYGREKSNIRHLPDTWEFFVTAWRYFWTTTK